MFRTTSNMQGQMQSIIFLFSFFPWPQKFCFTTFNLQNLQHKYQLYCCEYIVAMPLFGCKQVYLGQIIHVYIVLSSNNKDKVDIWLMIKSLIKVWYMLSWLMLHIQLTLVWMHKLLFSHLQMLPTDKRAKMINFRLYHILKKCFVVLVFFMVLLK